MSLCSVSDQVKSLWEEHTTGLPIMVPSLACWNSCAPTFQQVWEGLSKTSSKDLRVFTQGERSGQVSTAFCQLAKPDPVSPTYIVGMESGTLARQFPFNSCVQLQASITTYHENHMIFNVTPKYSFVDLHIDYGLDAISATLDECTKIWFLYPPTPQNLSLMAQERGQQAKLSRLADKLEGGIITRTTSTGALYIPAGCLHAVFTENGGFLVSIDCTTRLSVWPFSQYLRHQLHLDLDTIGLRDCYFLFLKCLEVSFANSQELLGFRSWINIEDLLRQCADHDNEWREKAASIWRQYREPIAIAIKDCPCIRSDDTSITCRSHRHTSWLFQEEGMPKSRTRRNNKRSIG